MSLVRSPWATSLARPVDLSAAWNATDDEVAERFHPLYRASLARLPDGAAVFRGLPFALGTRAAGRRWLVVDGPLVVDLPPGPASHLVVAHFADSWRDAHGERPAGMPVGWVFPTGQPLATYEVTFDDGSTSSLAVRRRFQVDDGIIGWGFLPFEAVGHRQDEAVDWRGPHARQGAGRYPPAGHAGPLMLLPGAWGGAQTGVADYVPTPDDDITYWLHAIPLPPGRRARALRLSPVAEGGGSTVVVAAVTLFHGTADPLVTLPRRQVRLEGHAAHDLPQVDLGLAVRSRPPEASALD
ncbi:MAG TPA: hypothetical protein VMH24_06475, partial [Candidatus Sulfotelmatobacter sp.]|nr:hypothetical protein [Candidatus Sulfotelmatobacter sp.]